MRRKLSLAGLEREMMLQAGAVTIVELAAERGNRYFKELFGKPVLYTAEEIPRETVPEGWHCYDLCETDRRPNKPSTIMDRAVWGRIGTVLSPAPAIPENLFCGRRRHAPVVLPLS